MTDNVGSVALVRLLVWLLSPFARWHSALSKRIDDYVEAVTLAKALRPGTRVRLDTSAESSCWCSNKLARFPEWRVKRFDMNTNEYVLLGGHREGGALSWDMDYEEMGFVCRETKLVEVKP